MVDPAASPAEIISASKRHFVIDPAALVVT
jgi:hypothetical protein